MNIICFSLFICIPIILTGDYQQENIFIYIVKLFSYFSRDLDPYMSENKATIIKKIKKNIGIYAAV